MNKKIIGIIICTLLICVTTLPAIASIYDEKKKSNTAPSTDVDWWYMFQHDSQLSGFSTSNAPNTNEIEWVDDFYFPFAGFCSPAVVDDKLYIGSSWFVLYKEQLIDILENAREKKNLLEYINNYNFYSSNVIPFSWDQYPGYFICIDANSGSVLWDFSTEGFEISSPAVSDGRVYFSSVVGDGDWTGQLYCLNADNGDLIWNHTICTSFYSSPIVADGKVFLGSIEVNGDFFIGKITCFNAINSDIIWEKTLGDNESIQFSTPAVANGNLFFSTAVVDQLGNIYCLDADTGIQKWNASAVPTLTSPAIADGYVYFSSFDAVSERCTLVCLDVEDGQEKWVYKMGYNILSGYSSPAVGYGKVFIATFIGFMEGCMLLCIDADDGAYIWSSTTSDWMMISSPAVADEKLYIASWLENSKLYCFDVNDGNKIWSYPISVQTMSSPAVANNSLYMADTYGNVYCFRSNNPPNNPTINGPASGKVGKSYTYSFTSLDPEGDDIAEYIVNWGEGPDETLSGPFPSGTQQSKSHTWTSKGTFIIKAKAIDINGGESDWSEFSVTIPRDKSTDNVLFRLLESFQLLERLLNLWL
jgi:outer membrane protein assembly factor BamB